MMGKRDPIVMRWECMNNGIVLWLARKNAILFHSLNELLHDLGASCTDAIIFHSLNA